MTIINVSDTASNTPTTSASSTTSNTRQSTSQTGQTTSSQSQSGSTQSSATSATSTTSVPNADPPGGVSMITPAASDASSTYYKIGTTVAISWSYTSVQVTPSAVAIQAYCAMNKYAHIILVLTRYYYPVAQNLSFDTTRVEWDTEAYEANATQPLLTYLPLKSD